jgi:hypothetical protein
MKRARHYAPPLLAVALSWALLSSSASKAGTVILNATDSGQYSFDPLSGEASHDPSNENYLAGHGGSIVESRNFFVFDLSGVIGPITGAELRLFNPSIGYDSPFPTETYAVSGVSTPIPVLEAGGFGSGLVPIFNDLGSGTNYGSRVMSAADSGTVVSISLNSAALDDLNRANGLFAVGGAVTTLHPSSPIEWVFGFSGSPTDTRQLVLTATGFIPEPSSGLLFVIGIAGMIGCGWFKQNGNASS